MTDRVEQRIGKYRLLSLLGEGSFGKVYLGEHVRDKTRVAVKVLKNQLKTEQLNDFINEVRTFRLNHPHIVQLLDIGLDKDDIPFLVTEYAPGGTLRQQHPKGTRLPLTTIIAYVTQIASALQYAHDRQLIHRDLKPENILVGNNQTILVGDFGLAIEAHDTPSFEIQNTIGTIAYRAPEQSQGKACAASDQYALGIMVYEWLCGERPFIGTFIEIAMQHLTKSPPSLCERVSAISPKVEQVVMKALAKEAKDRFDRIAAFGIALENAYLSSLLDPGNIDALELLQPNNHININDVEDIDFAPLSSNNNAPLLPVPRDNRDEADSIEDDMLGENDDENAPGAVPIPIPIVASLPDDEPEGTGGASSIPWRQSSGKRNVVGVPYQAGTLGPVGRGFAGAAVVPPTPGDHGNASVPRRKRSSRQLLSLVLTIVLLSSLLLCGGIALAAPGTLRTALGSIQKFSSNVIGGGVPTTFITITPKSALLSNTYVLEGILSGKLDPSQRQVQARQLTFTTKAQSKTVSATGQKQTPGTRSTGTLTFYNGNTSDSFVTAGTVFTDTQGRQIANDALVDIPAGNPSTGYGHVTVSAHGVSIGASGNIPAGEFTNYPCCGISGVGLSTNGAFTGGQDAQNYTVVQQSDIDTVANSFKQSALQTAQTALDGLKHANEQFVNKPQCTNNVTSNSNVGDKAMSVTVSVTATCTGEVYDQAGAEKIATNLLKGEADKDTGGNYVLSGNVQSSIISVTADSTGTLTLLTKAQGVWVYQFDATAKSTLAKLIAGKVQHDAIYILLQQAGVNKVDGISIANGGNTLPTDFNQIAIVVQSVAGVRGTPTVGPGAGSPTPGTNATPTITVTVQGS